MSSLPDPLKLGFTSIHVSSSAFLEAYPQNVMSNFLFKTAVPLPVKGDWTMAMQSIEYTNMFVNVEPSNGSAYDKKVSDLLSNPGFHKASLTYYLRRYIGNKYLFYVPETRPIPLSCQINRDLNVDDIKTSIENAIASQNVLKGIKYNWYKHKIELAFYDDTGNAVKTLHVRWSNMKLGISIKSFEKLFNKLASHIKTISQNMVTLVKENNDCVLNWNYPNVRQCKWKIQSPGHFLSYKLGISPSASSSHITLGESVTTQSDLNRMIWWTKPSNVNSDLTSTDICNGYIVKAYQSIDRTGNSTIHTFTISEDYLISLTEKNDLKQHIQGNIEGFNVSYDERVNKWVFLLESSSPWELIEFIDSNDDDTSIQACFRWLIGVSKTELPFQITKAEPFTPTYNSNFTIIEDNNVKKYISLSDLVTVEKVSDSKLQFIWNNKEYTHGYTDLTLSLKHQYGHEENVIQNIQIGSDTTIENYTHSWMTEPVQTISHRHPMTYNGELTIPIQPHSEISHPDLYLSQDTILVELGYKVSSTKAKVLVSCKRKLHAPGCYSSFEIIKNAIFETFTSMAYSSNNDYIDLQEWVEMEKKDYTAQCEFKLKPTTKNRYVGIYLNPHVSRLLGFREPASKEEKPYQIQLVSNAESLLPVPFSNDPKLLDLNRLIDSEMVQVSHRAKYMLNLQDGVHLMYIYMPNLLEKISVGESHLPLLATCPIEGKPGERVVREVINPDKRRLTQELLSECEVQLLDYQGRRIKFYTGVNPVNINLKLEAVQ